MIDYSKIYNLSSSFSRRTYLGVMCDYKPSEFLITRGEKEIGSALAIKHYMGESEPGDIVKTGDHLLLISDRVIELFMKHKISGWKIYDAIVFNKMGHIAKQKYHGIIVTGRCGQRDISRSELIFNNSFENSVLKGFYFKDDFWDDNDFCMSVPDAEGKKTASIFCSEKVRSLSKQKRISNMSLNPLSDYTQSLYSARRGASFIEDEKIYELMTKISR